MNTDRISNTRRIRGFTLIELLVTVVIVGILAALAVPSYRDHVRRGQIQEATAALSSGRIAIEQYFLDNRTFVDAPCPASTDHFVLSCLADATTYTITARGHGSVDEFVYTINQRNVRTTAGPWGVGLCWIDRKGGTC